MQSPVVRSVQPSSAESGRGQGRGRGSKEGSSNGDEDDDEDEDTDVDDVSKKSLKQPSPYALLTVDTSDPNDHNDDNDAQGQGLGLKKKTSRPGGPPRPTNIAPLFSDIHLF